jgi:hypothetical protein
LFKGGVYLFLTLLNVAFKTPNSQPEDLMKIPYSSYSLLRTVRNLNASDAFFLLKLPSERIAHLRKHGLLSPARIKQTIRSLRFLNAFSNSVYMQKLCMQKLTLKHVKAALKPLNITISKTPYDEFKVRVKGASKGEGYFTTDLGDALETGKLLAMHTPRP